MINKYLADAFIKSKYVIIQKILIKSTKFYENTCPMPHTADIYSTNPISHFVTYIKKSCLYVSVYYWRLVTVVKLAVERLDIMDNTFLRALYMVGAHHADIANINPEYFLLFMNSLLFTWKMYLKVFKFTICKTIKNIRIEKTRLLFVINLIHYPRGVTFRLFPI